MSDKKIDTTASNSVARSSTFGPVRFVELENHRFEPESELEGLGQSDKGPSRIEFVEIQGPDRPSSSTKQAKSRAGVVFPEIFSRSEKNSLDRTDYNFIGEVVNAIINLKVEYKLSTPHVIKSADRLSDIKILQTNPGNVYADFIFAEERAISKFNISGLDVKPKSEYFISGNIIKVDDMYYIIISSNEILARPIEAMEQRRPVESPPRPQTDLPRSDRPRWAEQNRKTEMVRFRAEPNLIDALNKAAADNSQTVSDWLREAVKEHLKRSSPKP